MDIQTYNNVGTTEDNVMQQRLESVNISSSNCSHGIHRYHFPNDPSDFDPDELIPGIKFVDYHDESQLQSVMKLVGKDLSEPYSIFTYRYFLTRFPELCIFAVPEKSNDVNNNNDTNDNAEPIGCIVCKIDEEHDDGQHTNNDSTTLLNPSSINQISLCGYLGMLAVDTTYRRSGIGTALAKRVIRRMKQMGCSSVILEAEVSNKAAMKLYEEKLGFLREELLVRYYLNWGDAYRLRLRFS